MVERSEASITDMALPSQATHIASHKASRFQFTLPYIRAGIKPQSSLIQAGLHPRRAHHHHDQQHQRYSYSMSKVLSLAALVSAGLAAKANGEN